MKEIKKVVIDDVSGQSPFFLHVVKEENLSKYFFFLEDKLGLNWSSEFCLYETPEEAEVAGNQFFKLDSLDYAKWISFMQVTHGYKLVEELLLTDPSDCGGTILYIFCYPRKNTYCFCLGDNDDDIWLEFEILDEAKEAGKKAYLNAVHDEAVYRAWLKKSQGVVSGTSFSQDKVGFIEAIGQEEVTWVSNTRFVSESMLGSAEIDMICQKLKDLGYELKTQGENDFALIPPVQFSLNSYKVEMAWKEVNQIIDDAIVYKRTPRQNRFFMRRLL